MGEIDVSKTEAFRAQKLNLEVQAEFRAERTRYIIYALLSLAAAIGFGFLLLPLMVFNACVLALIFLIQAAGSNDCLQMVRRWPAKRLMTDTSVLKPRSSETPSKGQPAT